MMPGAFVGSASLQTDVECQDLTGAPSPRPRSIAKGVDAMEYFYCGLKERWEVTSIMELRLWCINSSLYVSHNQIGPSLLCALANAYPRASLKSVPSSHFTF